MIDAAASAAWSTDKGAVIAGAVVAALRGKAIMLPATATIERAGITGRATARKRVHEALLSGLGPAQLAALDELLTLDPETGFTRLTSLRTIPTGPEPDHVREIVDKLARASPRYRPQRRGPHPSRSATPPGAREPVVANLSHRPLQLAAGARPWSRC